MKNVKINSTEASWDDRLLGASDAHVVVASLEHEAALDVATEMQAISIRLPKNMIEHYKLIAQYHGVGYQPLMRDVMSRFVPNELQLIAEAERKKAKIVEANPMIPKMKKAA
jgi:predicted DNA binding CopG/RHH family protein